MSPYGVVSDAAPADVAEMAIENVEAVLRGEITEPSVGTLAYRVLEFARKYGRATVTVSYDGMDVAPL